MKYFKDTLLSGYSYGDNLFAIYYGEPEYELRSDIIPDQTISIEQLQKRVLGVFSVDGQIFRYAWGAFYWMLDGSNMKYVYDFKIKFIDRSVAKLELVPGRKSKRYYRRLIDTEKSSRGMNDHIIGLIKVNNQRNQMWGSTTSIDSEGRKERFVSLPYFIAHLVEQKSDGAIVQGIEYWKNLPEPTRWWIGIVIAIAVTAIGIIAGIIL